MARTRGRGQGQEEQHASHPIVELLRESRDAVAASAAQEERPVKKRRVGRRIVVVGNDKGGEAAQSGSEVHPSSDVEAAETSSSRGILPQQVAYEDSSDTTDSDADWQDIDLDQRPLLGAKEDNSAPQALSLVLGAYEERFNSTPRKRPAINAAERKLRLELHKLHVLCLMHHTALRNHWCNDAKVQDTMRQTLPQRVVEYLDDDATQSQFQRNRSLVEGLEMSIESFNQCFTVSARGLAKPSWAISPERIADLEIPSDVDLPMRKVDFYDAADSLSASRDVGAQFFCAMLRSAGLDVRLVASLQVLPLVVGTPGPGSDGGAVTRGHTPQKQGKKGRPESRFPVYWVEVFNAAYQKWVPVDALVTRSIGKANKLEPPASDSQNALIYAMAFETDGSARDVTRRYAHAYNAKTRKARVENTKQGLQWWRRVMRIFQSLELKDRDAIEESQLAARTAQEPMPRNLQDFKGHPVYALERHLRRNEALYPRRAIGKVAAGKGASSENVFRRADVHEVRSVDAWFRLGREVKGDSQPLKFGRPRRGGRLMEEEEDEEAKGQAKPGVPLFGSFQTALYVPPSVVRGRVPRNAFGNLDVYVPGMIPPGGAHVKHALAARAARLLGIDYADAVTGFEFKNRQGSAVVTGVVVALELADAVASVIVGFAEDAWREAQWRRTEGILALWKRFLVALRIRQRVQRYVEPGEEEGEEDLEDDGDDSDEYMDDDEHDQEGMDVGRNAASSSGRDFVPPTIEVIHSIHAKPTSAATKVRQSRPIADIARSEDHQKDFGSEEGGGFVANDEEMGGGFVPEEEGGGFLLDEAGSGLPSYGRADEPALNARSSRGEIPSNEDGGGFLSETPTFDGAEDIDSGSVSTNDIEAAQLAQALEESIKEIEATEAAPMIRGEDEAEKAVCDGQGNNDMPVEIVGHKAQVDAVLATEEDSDRGSLLSHDPEDEDADPDWLE